MPLMGLREYAKHRGCRENAVRTALASGRIKAVQGKIDSEQADMDWEANTDPIGGMRQYARKESDAAAQTDEPRPLPDGHARAPTGREKYAQVRAEREEWNRRLLQQKFEEKEKLLVSAADIDARYNRFVVRTRAKLLAVPARIKGEMPHLSRTDVVNIDRMIREALDALRKPDVSAG